MVDGECSGRGRIVKNCLGAEEGYYFSRLDWRGTSTAGGEWSRSGIVPSGSRSSTCRRWPRRRVEE